MPRKYSFFVGFFILLLLLTLLVAIVFIATKFPSTNAALASLRHTYESLDGFNPEPKEQLAFQISLIFLIPFCWLSWFIASKVVNKWPDFFTKHGELTIFATVVLGILLIERIFSSYTQSYFSASSYIYRSFLTSLFVFPTFAIMLHLDLNVKSYNLRKKSYYIIGLFICLILSAETVFGDKYLIEHTALNHHFEAYFDSIVQVFLGKVLLIDLFPQYGYYAYFYNLIFSIIGLSTLKFTIIVSILRFLIFLMMLALVEKIIKNHWLALCSFMLFLWLTRIRVPLEVTEDPYFQYMPHRFLFPIFSLIMIMLYLDINKTRTKLLFTLTLGLFSGVALLWNFEVGIVSTLTILAAIYYESLLNSNGKSFPVRFIAPIPQLIGLIAIAISAFWFGIMIITQGRLASSDYFKIFQYLKLFTSVGFSALPIPTVFHPWVVVATIYIATIFRCIVDVFDTSQGVSTDLNIRFRKTMTFSLGIIGLGLFSTYLTRSHDQNLINPSWPAIFIVGIWISEYFEFLRRNLKIAYISFDVNSLFNFLKQHSLTLLFLVTYYFVSSSIVSISLNSGRYYELVNDRTHTLSMSVPRVMINQLESIREQLKPSDRLIIFSSYDALLYLYLNHPRYMPDRAWNELFTRQEFDSVRAVLQDPPDNLLVVVDPKFWYLKSFSFHAFSQRTYSNGIFLFRK